MHANMVTEQLDMISTVILFLYMQSMHIPIWIWKILYVMLLPSKYYTIKIIFRTEQIDTYHKINENL